MNMDRPDSGNSTSSQPYPSGVLGTASPHYNQGPTKRMPAWAIAAISIATTVVTAGVKEDATGISYSQITCILNQTEMPASARARFENTRAIDGMQEASWEGYKATWNYHPDTRAIA